MNEGSTAAPNSQPERPRLLFISPRFLFPAHSGGAIRTGQILSGMKGGCFHITLVAPGSEQLEQRHRAELLGVADEWQFWRAPNTEDRSRLSKARFLLDQLPLTVAADRSADGCALVQRELAKRPDVVVVDFVHAGVLLPKVLEAPCVVFTHNCEAEIYERHAASETRWWMRAIWRQQERKMARFERAILRQAARVVAVAERDAERFESQYGIGGVRTIPTGVDLARFRWAAPQCEQRVVFAGSMDSAANIDGIGWLLDSIWPHVAQRIPHARLVVVGKRPPAELLRKAEKLPHVQFTGRVPEVEPYLAGADVFVIPLRVGGGTRIKAFEAMACGAPVVSTSVGIEGLVLEAGRHYLCADDPQEMAEAVIALLLNPEMARRISREARSHVEQHASHLAAARRFETICMEVLRDTMRAAPAAAPGPNLQGAAEALP